jgi:hypothetical protein
MAEFLLQLRSLFEWVDTFPSSIAIRESLDLYSWVLTFHVVSMSLFAGLVLMMDLRLLGIGNMRTPFSRLQRALFPWQMVGMTASAITGLLLVYAEPMRFFVSFPFWIKVVLMVMAGLNALAFHYTTFLTVARWDMDRILPFGARLAGAVGVALWAAVVVSGRLIAYDWFTTR